MPITRRVAAKRGTPPMFLHDGQFRGHEGCYSGGENPFLGKFRNWNTPNNYMMFIPANYIIKMGFGSLQEFGGFFAHKHLGH